MSTPSAHLRVSLRAIHPASAPADRSGGDRHAIAMSLLGVICVVDAVLRTAHYGSARHTPAAVLALTFVALGLAAIGGELGGQLVYRRGIGVSLPPARGTEP